MKLPRPFVRLPFRFDVRRLEEEVRALPASAWNRHPNDYEGNSSVRLISVEGGENDDVGGRMRPTGHLLGSPYLQQVLASFGVVWSRSRLMRLAPGAGVPEHADINYHWFNRVRVHIPVLTRPEVRFHCGDASVHMGPGEAWIFDNWRRHRVENPSADERIHLVADTTGSAAFWRAASSGAEPVLVPYAAGAAAAVLTEQHGGPMVMPPSELELLAGDLGQELEAASGHEDVQRRLALFRVLLAELCREWRQLWLLHGEADAARPIYERLIAAVRQNAGALCEGIVIRTNGVPAQRVLEGRILRHALRTGTGSAAPDSAADAKATGAAAPHRAVPRFDRPVIIVAAPRSGSTLLFETLACTPQFVTLGGEAHWLVESHAELRPGAPGVDSNRLTAEHCGPGIADAVRRTATDHLQEAGGRPWPGGLAVRLLEKTPKNALRIPFLDRVFPDARYVFLWRDPRENISSIIEGWRDGRWVTYPRLPGREGPWSFLLPPGWQQQDGRPVEEIAAWQWDRANRIVLEDLSRVPRDRWHAVGYAEFVANPDAIVRRLAAFCDIAFDDPLARRVSGALPHSRYTLTPPAPGKWRRNAEAIERILPGLEETWARLRAL